MISMPLSDIVYTLTGTITIDAHPLACDVHVDPWNALCDGDITALEQYALDVGRNSAVVRLIVRGKPVRQLRPSPPPILEGVGGIRTVDD